MSSKVGSMWTVSQSVRLPDLQCHSADVAQPGTAADRRSQGWDAQSWEQNMARLARRLVVF